MRKVLFLLMAIAILLIEFILYRARSDRLDVDPDAAREIEKAKQR
jgi:hypothetical protein